MKPRRFSTLLRFACLLGQLLFLVSSGRALGAPSSPPAATASVPHRPVIALATSDASRGPLSLSPHDGAYLGELTIANDGAEPLVVSRIAIRGDDEDVRAPSRLSVRFAEGGTTSATIPPATSKRAVVTWSPERNPRVRQVFAHVVVTSNDEQAGEVALGVRAQLASPLSWLTAHALSWLTFLPLLGALAILGMSAMGRGDERSARRIALVVTGLQCALALWLYAGFRGDVTRLDGNDGYQFIEHAVWVRSFAAEYFLGVDGLSMPMVLLTALLGFIGCLASEGIAGRTRAYYALYLVLATAMMGVFVALDLLLLYVFWEAILLPVYFLIGIWGGPRREYAATKFFLYALVGSVLLLLAFVALYVNADRTFLVDGSAVTRTFSIPELARVSFAGKHLTILGAPWSNAIWVLLLIGFAMRIPMFPFHTWLPDSQVEAPTPVSVVIAGIVLNMGAYGMLRVSFAVLPDATRWGAGAVVAFGVVNILYGAFCAMAQDDLKRMVAYASVSQMGFCLVGMGSLTPEGIAACLVQMVSHGIIVAMLLLLVGAIEDRARTRSLRAFGGLAAEMPLYAIFFGLALMASLGLPGLSGFWGEALALFGSFPGYRALTTIAAGGLILSAAYDLGAFRRLFLGAFPESWRTSAALAPFGGRFPDLTGRELASLVPLALLVVVLGFWPVPLFTLIAGGLRDVTSLVDPAGPDQIASLLHQASRALAMNP